MTTDHVPGLSTSQRVLTVARACSPVRRALPSVAQHRHGQEGTAHFDQIQPVPMLSAAVWVCERRGLRPIDWALIGWPPASARQTPQLLGIDEAPVGRIGR